MAVCRVVEYLMFIWDNRYCMDMFNLATPESLRHRIDFL